MNPNQIRQGDVLLIKTESIPSEATEEKNPDKHRVVLAYGEATGHAHALHFQGDPEAVIRSSGGARFLNVKKEATLKHEEHTHTKIAPGNYILPVQVEYTPKEIRRVAD